MGYDVVKRFMPDLNPEQRAREQIDAQLLACGWVVQDYSAVDFSAGRGVALREVKLKTGRCDYFLLVDRKPVGMVEAKKEGTTLSGVAEQSARYASGLPDFLAAGFTGPLPFLYESTGVETFFRDQRDPDPRSRQVFSFHRPETLADWTAEPNTLRARLKAMPTAHPLVTSGMRQCQIEAITGLETSFAESRPRALIHMATGAGKTFTACAFTYRLIKYAGARRILFLVDRSNLGKQARDEFHAYRTPDTGRLFTELYNVQHLTSPNVDDVCRVTICTIQRLYSILRGEELAEGADDLSGAELAAALGSTRTRDVAYNPAVPIEKFDFIDMIATGTDIKPLEVLIFLRDVRSRVYFEQMKGRGTRVLSTTDLQSVSGEDARSKTRFIIVDAVGVCEGDKTESRPLDRQPTVPLKALLQRVLFPAGRDEDTLTTLAARLARLDRELEPAQRQQISTASGGQTPATLAGALLRAFDPDAIAEHATGRPGAEAQEIAPAQFEAARQQLIAEACAPFDKPALRQTLETLKKETEQALDIYTPDEVLSQGFDEAAKAKAAGLVQEFRDYLVQHQTEIDALQILYSRPFKHRLTELMLKELEKKLRDQHATWTEDRLWDAFAVTAPDQVKGRTQAGRFADLVALVRFALKQQPVLAPFADSVSERFDEWLAGKTKAGTVFTPEQLVWLRLIRDHIATSLTIETDDFDFAPFSQRGGLGKVYQLFGEKLPALLEELNEVLAA